MLISTIGIMIDKNCLLKIELALPRGLQNPPGLPPGLPPLPPLRKSSISSVIFKSSALVVDSSSFNSLNISIESAVSIIS